MCLEERNEGRSRAMIRILEPAEITVEVTCQSCEATEIRTILIPAENFDVGDGWTIPDAVNAKLTEWQVHISHDGDGYQTCPECVERNAAWHREYYRKQRRNDYSYRCGSCKHADVVSESEWHRVCSHKDSAIYQQTVTFDNRACDLIFDK